MVKKEEKLFPLFNSVGYFKELMKNDQITETKKIVGLDNDENSTVVIYSYHGKKSKKKVELVKIVNGGHNIPNPNFSHWPKQLGNVNKELDLPKFITNYFLSLE